MADKIKPVPESLPHSMAENFVVNFFCDRGYTCIDIAYHHNINTGDYYALSRCYSPTALAYRTMADFVAVKQQESFYVEVKVSTSPTSCFIEAYPLALHKMESSLGIKCYYIYAGEITHGRMVACAVEDIHPVELVITSRGGEIGKYLIKAFPESKVTYREARAGTSGDPFVRIDKSEILKWKPVDAIWT